MKVARRIQGEIEDSDTVAVPDVLRGNLVATAKQPREILELAWTGALAAEILDELSVAGEELQREIAAVGDEDLAVGQSRRTVQAGAKQHVRVILSIAEHEDRLVLDRPLRTLGGQPRCDSQRNSGE